LNHDDDQSIQLFDWAGSSAAAVVRARDEVVSLTARYRSQEKVVQNLHEQLKDLIAAKEQHETALLQKFRELMNAKKQKIRDQQRLLSTADPTTEQGDSIFRSQDIFASETKLISSRASRQRPSGATSTKGQCEA
jgi:hypothetical protein